MRSDMILAFARKQQVVMQYFESCVRFNHLDVAKFQDWKKELPLDYKAVQARMPSKHLLNVLLNDQNQQRLGPMQRALASVDAGPDGICAADAQHGFVRWVLLSETLFLIIRKVF